MGATAKENVVAVFTRLGGTATMAEWAKENRTEFYKLYAKLIPTEATVTVNDERPLSYAERLEKELQPDSDAGIAVGGTIQ